MGNPWRVMIEVICPDEAENPGHGDVGGIVEWGYVVEVKSERLYAEKDCAPTKRLVDIEEQHKTQLRIQIKKLLNGLEYVAPEESKNWLKAKLSHMIDLQPRQPTTENKETTNCTNSSESPETRKPDQ